MKRSTLTAACLSTAAVLLAAECLAAAAVHYKSLVEEILEIWESADFVCLGESHGRKSDSDLRIALVTHPAFVQTVDVIVVEFANPLRQQILDRLILEGEDLSYEELAPVWRDTSAPKVWDSPIYESFLRAVRAANIAMPREERVRLVGAAVPVDWPRVTQGEDLMGMVNRGSVLAGAAEREVLAAGLKGLGIYGAGHCERRRGFLAGLEHRYPGKARAVLPFYGLEAAREGRQALGLGAEPGLVQVRDTKRAKLAAAKMFPTGQYDDPSTLGGVVDAIVYHGDVGDVIVEADPELYQGAYLAELERRSRIYREFAELARRRFPDLADED